MLSIDKTFLKLKYSIIEANDYESYAYLHDILPKRVLDNTTKKYTNSLYTLNFISPDWKIYNEILLEELIKYEQRD